MSSRTDTSPIFEHHFFQNFPRRAVLSLAGLNIFSGIIGILLQVAVIFINDSCSSITVGSSKIGLYLSVFSLMSGIIGFLSKHSKCWIFFYFILNLLSYMIAMALIGLAIVGIDDLRGANFWSCQPGDVQSKQFFFKIFI